LEKHYVAKDLKEKNKFKRPILFTQLFISDHVFGEENQLRIALEKMKKPFVF
jgi:hypothetical protein